MGLSGGGRLHGLPSPAVNSRIAATIFAMTRIGYDIKTEGLPEPEPGPSKTRVKDEMHDLQDFGQALLELPHDRFARIEMNEALRDAFNELGRITNLGARKRQAGYIGKLLQHVDVTPFRIELESFRSGQAQAAKGFPDLARWRDRLLADDSALTEWCARYPSTDTRALRSLIRNARKEETEAAAEAAHSGKPIVRGRQFRALFQQLRATADALDGNAG